MPPLPLGFDFSRPQRALRQPRRALGWGLLAAGVLALLAAMDRYQTELDGVEAVAARVERLKLRQAQAGATQALAPAVAAGLRQAGIGAGLLAVPWERLWRAIETSRGDAIALLSVDLDAGRADIALAGEARDFAALGEFTRALGEQGAFERVSLVQHKLSDGSPPAVVRFELRLTWRAPAAEAGA